MAPPQGLPPLAIAPLPARLHHASQITQAVECNMDRYPCPATCNPCHASAAAYQLQVQPVAQPHATHPTQPGEKRAQQLIDRPCSVHALLLPGPREQPNLPCNMRLLASQAMDKPVVQPGDPSSCSNQHKPAIHAPLYTQACLHHAPLDHDLQQPPSHHTPGMATSTGRRH